MGNGRAGQRQGPRAQSMGHENRAVVEHFTPAAGLSVACAARCGERQSSPWWVRPPQHAPQPPPLGEPPLPPVHLLPPLRARHTGQGSMWTGVVQHNKVNRQSCWSGVEGTIELGTWQERREPTLTPVGAHGGNQQGSRARIGHLALQDGIAAILLHSPPTAADTQCGSWARIAWHFFFLSQASRLVPTAYFPNYLRLYCVAV